jgi:hypothetical protein
MCMENFIIFIGSFENIQSGFSNTELQKLKLLCYFLPCSLTAIWFDTNSLLMLYGAFQLVIASRLPLRMRRVSTPTSSRAISLTKYNRF